LGVMLELRGVWAGYGFTDVVKGVSLTVGVGEVLVVLGRNGAGKSSLLKTVAGHLTPRRGDIFLDGIKASGAAPHRLALLGMRYLPQDRGVFTRLTVEENLRIAEGLNPSIVDDACSIYPMLRQLLRRPVRELSGGEQQVLAVARALASRPRILVLDEPSTGLMPPLIKKLVETVRELCRGGASALIAEQNPALVFELADRVALMEDGKVTCILGRDDLPASGDILKRTLGLSFQGGGM